MVYVDKAFIPYKGMKMSHMVADSTYELVLMAGFIGVDSKWIQHQGTYKEHFDISMSKREAAIKAGAIEITSKELAKFLARKRINTKLG